MTEELLETIFDAIKNDPLGPCPNNTFVMCDVPPRFTPGNDRCFWLQECLDEWESSGKRKSLS